MSRTRRTASVLTLTADETIRALHALEPRLPRLTPRQLRYLDSRTVGCLQPARVPGARGRRVYRAADLALIRLVLRVAAHRSTWQAWCALAYLGDELRAAIATRQAVALVFQGARATVAPLRTTPAGADVYAVRACVDGVDAAMRAARGQTAALWNGWTWVSPGALDATSAQAREACRS